MTTHEHHTRSTTELSPEAKAMLTMDRLESWRAQQSRELSRLRLKDGAMNFNAENEFRNSFNDFLDVYLDLHGFTDSDEHYDVVRQIYSDASIFAVSDDEWGNRPSARGETATDDRPEKYLFEDRLKTAIGDEDDSDPEPDEEDDTAEAERQERLEQLRLAKHEAYVAKINTGRFSPRRKQRMQAYEESEAAYTAALEEDIRLRLLEQLGDDMNDDQRRETIEELAQEQIHADELEQHQLLLDRGGKRARFLARYDKMSTWKKVGVGALIAGGGVAAGFLAGFAGAGAAAIGAGLAGYRFGRTAFLAKSRIYREPSDNVGFSYDSSSDLSAEQQVLSQLNLRARNRIEAADKAKERAVMIGLGSAALGASAGTVGAVLHAGQVGDVGVGDGHWRAGYLEHLFDSDADAPTDAPSDAPGTLDPDVDSSTDTPDTEAPQTEAPETEAPNTEAPDLVQQQMDNLTEAAQTIRQGEGWYETFADHGIAAEHHAELLKEVGPQLDKAYPDLAYFDNHANEWRIGYSGDLPKGASEIILQTAHDHGWLADAGVGAGEVGSQEILNVDHGDGLTHVLMDQADANGVDVTPEQAYDAHRQIVDARGSDYINKVGGNSGADVYSMGDSKYEVGISSPGEYTAEQGAAEMINDFADDGQINNSIETDVTTAPNGTDTPSRAPSEELFNDPDAITPDSAVVDGIESPRANLLLGDVRDILNSGDLSELETRMPDEAFQEMAKDFSGYVYGNADKTPLFTQLGGTTGEYHATTAPDGVTLPDSAKIAIADYIQRNFVSAA